MTPVTSNGIDVASTKQFSSCKQHDERKQVHSIYLNHSSHFSTIATSQSLEHVCDISRGRGAV